MINALLFLIDAVCNFFGLLLLSRFFMQMNGVSFANPIGELVSALTGWLVRPLQRLMPRSRRFDFAALLGAWWLQCLLLLLIFTLRSVGADAFGSAGLAALILWRGATATLRLAIYLFIGAIVVQAVLSWVNPYSPLARPLQQLNAPLLRPLQRLLPLVGGIDLAPLVAILLLQAALILL